MAFENSSENVVLQDTFYSHPSATICELILTEKTLFINCINKGKNEVEKIYLNDVVGCRVLHGKDKLKNDPKDIYGYFCIYAYMLKTSAGILSKQLRRERRALTFQTRKYADQEENIRLVERWKLAIVAIIRGISCIKNGEVCIPSTVPPARKFLILVNPKSGCGKAHQVFKQWVAPILHESEIQYELLITDRANCGRDYVRKADLSGWDGIVVVSGDGLLFEVYNGLMARPDWKEVVKIPVGIIPGGSGNGLARAINYAIGEPYDVNVVTPSVLNVIRGRVMPMDLVRVQSPKECFYSFLSVGWGLMADIDIESERLRAIGEARFAVWAVIRAIGLRKYKGRLSYLPVNGYKSAGFAKNIIEPKPKRSKTIDCQLAWSEDSYLTKQEEQPINKIFRSKSFGTQEPEITGDADGKTVRLLKFSYSGDKFDSYLTNIPEGAEMPQSIPHHHCREDEVPVEHRNGLTLDDCVPVEHRNGKHPGVCMPVEHQNGQQQDDSMPGEHRNGNGCVPVEHQNGVGNLDGGCLPPLDRPVPDSWTVLEDEFVMVYACHQTHLSTDVLFAPDAKMDDGIMWLIVIRAGISRAQVMYFLSCLQSGEHVNVPCVDVIPVHAFRLEPSKPEGYLTVDGEVIPCSPIQAEVLPSVARVMTR